MKITNLATAIILLLVGIAVFITGMNLMSSGLKKSCGRGVKNLFKKIQNNPLAGLGIGTGTTAIIQSSAATSVMVIGFINAGIMSIAQGISVILGAYIGTTVTGLLVSVSSLEFSISVYLTSLAFIGVVMMFFKKEKVKNIGEILLGLGLLFFGLESMKSAFGYEQINNFFVSLFSNISFPLLLMLLGALFTALVQSSSATSGIVIVMVSQGSLSFSLGMYIVLGATIGTVITTIIATIGGSVNAKRTGLMCLIIRCFTALVALAIIWPLNEPISNFFINTFRSSGLALAMFLVIFNIIFMLALLPFVNKFAKLSTYLVKDKQLDSLKSELKFIDSQMINSPSIATMQVKKEISHMLDLAFLNYNLGFNRIVNQDINNDKEIIKNEEAIDYINNEVTNFLISISNKVTNEDEKLVGSYFHVVNDIERIGDHAYNFYEASLKMEENELKFSDLAKKGLNEMNSLVISMFELAKELFNEPSKEKLLEIHSIEDKTDELKLKLSEEHYERIRSNKCTMELSPFYSTFVSELERVADHLTNIGYSQVSPTGDDSNL